MAIKFLDKTETIRGIQVKNLGANIETPNAGFTKIFAKADGLYYIGSNGIAIGPLAVSGASLPHATSHKHGGTDEVGTSIQTANAIPKSDSNGTLDQWISNATTSTKGKVELATDGETTSGLAVQANDSRLSNQRTPLYHSSIHKHDGGDEVATVTPGAYAIPKAGSAGVLDSGWLAGGTFVPLMTPISSSTLFGVSISTMGKTLKTATSEFSGLPSGAKSLYCRCAIRDTASAGSTNYYVIVGPSSTSLVGVWVRCGGKPNNFYEDQVIIIPLNSSGQFYIQAATSGASTMAIYLELHGYFI